MGFYTRCFKCIGLLAICALSCRNDALHKAYLSFDADIKDYSEVSRKWHIEDKVYRIDKFPDFPGFSKRYDSELTIVYSDEREDFDADGNPLPVAVVKTNSVRSVWDGNFGALESAAPVRPGYKFEGWKLDSGELFADRSVMIDADGDECAIKVSIALRKYLAASGMSEQSFLEVTGLGSLKDDITDELYDVRIFQPGDDISEYYKKIICAICYGEMSDVGTGECGGFPSQLTLHSMWSLDSEPIVVNYYNDSYDSDGNVCGSTLFKSQRMYAGTPSFGEIISAIPKRSGNIFKGWKISGAEDLFQPSGQYKAYFAEGNSNGVKEYELHSVWKQDTSYFYKEQFYSFGKRVVANKIVPIDGGPIHYMYRLDGFYTKFSAMPAGVSGFISRDYIDPVKTSDPSDQIFSYASGLNAFTLPKSFAIADTDVTANELYKLLGFNDSEKWGFESNDLKYRKADYEINILDDFSTEIFKRDELNEIIISGAKLNMADYSLKGNSFYGYPDNNYPILFMNLPQAMLICNMFTAAYNNYYSSDKLTYAYAYGLVDDINSESIIKSVSDAVQYIKNSNSENLSLPGATGFRLPKAYEYELAASVIPLEYSSISEKSGLLNSGFPVFADDRASFWGKFFCALPDTDAMVTPNADYYKNYVDAFGLAMPIGGIRRWLDTKLTGVGDLIRINGVVSDAIEVAIKVPYALKGLENMSRDASAWFSNFSTYGLTAEIKSISSDGETIAFTISKNGKSGQEGLDISSSLTIPGDRFKTRNASFTIENAVDISIVSDSWYMVRSGSFLQIDQLNEFHVHKMYDKDPDMRKSSSPYNYAFIDLGMRLARTI